MAETLILIADAKQERRDPTAMALAISGLAGRVVPCESGRKLVTEFTRAMQRGDQVRGVVLDVNLAIIGGKTCSIAMRAIESAYQTPASAILFVASKEADANLKRVLAYVKNARCVSIGETADPEKIVATLREMVP